MRIPSIFAFAIGLFLIHVTMVPARAAESHPDFTGVYFALRPAVAPRVGLPPGGQERHPAVFAPLLDGSQGFPPTGPPLNPEYMTKWKAVQASRIAGSSETDSVAKCIPQGMPMMMNAAYGMEITQGKDRMFVYSELNDSLRRIYLDGRKPSAAVLEDTTYAGYSSAHWEGDTLVVFTNALRADHELDPIGSPHSDALTIAERFRFIRPGVLEDRMVVRDPKAFTKDWEVVYTYSRAASPDDQLREFACAEGLSLVR